MHTFVTGFGAIQIVTITWIFCSVDLAHGRIRVPGPCMARLAAASSISFADLIVISSTLASSSSAAIFADLIVISNWLNYKACACGLDLALAVFWLTKRAQHCYGKSWEFGFSLDESCCFNNRCG